MHSLSYYATLLAGVASASLALEERAPCPPVQIVALGGEGTVVGDLGYLDSTVKAIQDRIPEAELFQIGYPANSDSPTAIASGVPQLQDHLSSYVPQCPDTKLITIGYSAGGAAVMDVLCGAVDDGSNPLDAWYRHHIIANIIYGDPTFVAGLSYDVGTCAGSGKVPRVRPGACFPFGKKTKSYCFDNDDVCCDGDDVAIHFTYPQTYDQDVAQWAHAKWTYYQNHKEGNMGSEWMGPGM